MLTVYEMKLKAVTIGDINVALEKLAAHPVGLRNYIFITTEPVDLEVLRLLSRSRNVTLLAEIEVSP